MSDRKYNILFWPDINYEPGHWRPVMSMAQKVKSAINCDIRFLCTPECKPIVEAVKTIGGNNLFSDSEITTILSEFFPVGYSTLASEKPEEAHSRINHCLKIANGEFDNLLRNFKPDLLIAGYFVSMEALLVQYRYKHIYGANSEMPIIVTTTFLRHPSEDPEITSLRFLAHHAQEQISKLMEAATGTTNYSGSFLGMQSFVNPLNNVTELITCPPELDHDHFVGKHRTNTHYVEPCILDVDPNNTPAKNPALIYASAGSRVRDYVDSAKAMFRTLINMINTPRAYERNLEMAVGFTLKEEFEKLNIADGGESNSTNRIEIKEWIDQVDCLKRARSAVAHGGLATIKECIYFGVPFVVIPMGKDQMDNALRVANKKIGSIVMLGNLTDEMLYQAVLAAEQNTDIQRNLQRLRTKFVADESAARSVELIKNVLGTS